MWTHICMENHTYKKGVFTNRETLQYLLVKKNSDAFVEAQIFFILPFIFVSSCFWPSYAFHLKLVAGSAYVLDSIDNYLFVYSILCSNPLSNNGNILLFCYDYKKWKVSTKKKIFSSSVFTLRQIQASSKNK